jgi:hypothetical protein
MPIGTCKLCLLDKELRGSHYLPKGLLRYLQEHRLSNPNPIMVTPDSVFQTSHQITDYVLFGDCEQRFNDNGERWVIHNMARIGSFPIWQKLHESTPLAANEDRVCYAGASIPGLRMDQLAYFAMSIFWRGSVHSWKDRAGNEHGIDLGIYEEPTRQFLLDGLFPDDIALTISIWRTKEDVAVGAYFPAAGDTRDYATFLFYIPGVEFLLSLGKNMPVATRASCSVMKTEKLIYASHSVKRNTRGTFRHYMSGPDRLRRIEETLAEVEKVRKSE